MVGEISVIKKYLKNKEVIKTSYFSHLLPKQRLQWLKKKIEEKNIEIFFENCDFIILYATR